MLRVNLTQFGRSWDLPRDKILEVIPQSIIGQALEAEPDITSLDLSHPDVKPEALDLISNYLQGKEPTHSVPGLESSARYLNIPWLQYYTDPLYDQIIAHPFFLDMYLEQAARDGNIYMVSYLLQKGAKPVNTVIPEFQATFAESHPPKGFPEKPYSFSSPFRSAAEGGHLDILKLLLADPRMVSLPDLPNVLRDALELAVN